MAKSKVRELPESIRTVTEGLAGELARAFERPVKLRIGEQGTISNNAFDGAPLNLQIEADRLARVRSETKLVQLFTGSVYQQAAHALFPAEAQYAEAGEAQYVLHVLNDEHALRNAIAAHPDWDAPMRAYADSILFVKSNQKSAKIELPVLYGRSVDEPARYTVPATTQYAERFNCWAYAFRRHIALPETADAQVLAATRMVPENLKDLSKDDVLKLAREIHTALAAGIVPEQEPVAVVEQPAVETDEQILDYLERPPLHAFAAEAVLPAKQETEEESTLVDPAPEADLAGPWWHDKRLVAVALISGAVFSGLFMKFGATFWLVMATFASLGVGALALGVIHYRSQIGAAGRSVGDAFVAAWRAFSSSWRRGTHAFLNGAERLFDGIGAFFKHPMTKLVMKVTGVGLGLTALGAAFYWLPFGFFLLLLAIAGFGASLSFVKTGGGGYLPSGGNYVAEGNELGEARARVGLKLTLAISAGIFAFGLYELLSSIGISGVLMAIGAIVVFFVVLGVTAAYIIPPEKGASFYERNKPGIVQFRDALGDMFKAFGKVLAMVLVGIWAIICAVAIFFWGYIYALLKVVGTLGLILLSFLRDCAVLVWAGICAAAYWTNLSLKVFGWNIEPRLQNLWDNVYCRVAIVAGMPLGAVFCMVWAILSTAAEGSIWLLIPLVVALVVVMVLTALNYKKLLDLIANQKFVELPELAGTSQGVPLDLTTREWTPIDDVRPMLANVEVLGSLMPKATACSRPVRLALERLGERTKARDDQRTGVIGEEPHRVVVGNLNIREDNLPVQLPSVDLRIGVDCSSSQSLESKYFANRGGKFETSQLMALIAEHAMKDQKRVTGGVYGYNDGVIFDCGKPGQYGVTGLESRGGNNDTAMLAKLREASLASGQDVKIVVVINDAQPADCSALSFNDMVAACRRDGVFVIQMVTDDDHPAAPGAYVINLCRTATLNAATQLAQILLAIGEEVTG